MTTSRPATEVSAKFEQVGREAHRNGESAAPALNAEVRDALGDVPVSHPMTKIIMRAFARGYQAEVDAEVARLVASWS